MDPVSSSILNGQSIARFTVHYIAMELIEGDTIGEYIKRGAPLQTVLELIQQVADAVAKAHAAGILHRDLKPDNIMVTPDGRAKVVDLRPARFEAWAVAAIVRSALRMERIRLHMIGRL